MLHTQRDHTPAAGWRRLIGSPPFGLDRRSWFAVAGMLVLATALWSMAGSLIMRWEWMTATDLRVNRALAASRTAALNSWSSMAGLLASTTVKVVLTLVAMVVARWRLGRWREAVMLGLPLVVEASAFILSTSIVKRPRPDVLRLDASPVDSSFPSGHVAAATVYLAFAVVAWWLTGRRWVFVAVGAVVAAIAGAVAWSRTYRGMHHPSDVVAGALLGAVSVIAVWSIIGRNRPTDVQGVR